MQSSGFDECLLPALLNWDCEAMYMQEPQQFTSAFEELAGCNFPKVLPDTNMTQNLSNTSSKRSSSDMVQPPSRTERKLEINRRSQKKVRERRKVLSRLPGFKLLLS